MVRGDLFRKLSAARAFLRMEDMIKGCVHYSLMGRELERGHSYWPGHGSPTPGPVHVSQSQGAEPSIILHTAHCVLYVVHCTYHMHSK